MNRLFVLFLTLFLCGTGSLFANANAALSHLSDTLKANKYAFTPAVKKAYLAYGFAKAKEDAGAQINQATWGWFYKNPDVMSAALAADYPFNPKILINFQRLALPWSSRPHIVSKWKQLILAFAIRYRNDALEIDRLEDWDPEELMKLVLANGSYAWQTDAMLPKLTDEETTFTKWLMGPQNLTDKRPRRRIFDLMEITVNEINIMGEGRFRITKFPRWDTVAVAGKLFPLYVNGTPTHQRALALQMWRWEKNPLRSGAAVNLEKAEWPILLYLTALDPIDEGQFLFGMFLKKKVLPALGLGQVLVQGGRPAEIAKRTPENRPVYYAKSKWNPKKDIRLYNTAKKDQGGKMQAFGWRTIGQPASAVGAPPGGKFYYTGKSRQYGTFFESAIEEDGATVDNFLRIETADPSYPIKGNTQVANMIGLAVTVSQGLDSFEDGRMAINLASLVPGLTREQQQMVLESAFVNSPLDGNVLYRLADFYYKSNDHDATVRMLWAARQYFATVVGKSVTDGLRRSAQAKVAKIMKDKPMLSAANAPVIPLGTLTKLYTDRMGWFHYVCSEIVRRNFEKRPGNKTAIRHSAELLKAEHQYQLKCCGKGGPASPIERRTKMMQKLVNEYNQDSK